MWLKYLKLKYKPNGRDDNGVDCYGLFLRIQSEVWGRTLPDYIYSNDNVSSRNLGIVNALKSYPARLQKLPFAGCGVIMKCGGVDSHIGTCIDDKSVIHISEKGGCKIEKIEDLKKRWELKFYEILSI